MESSRVHGVFCVLVFGAMIAVNDVSAVFLSYGNFPPGLSYLQDLCRVNHTSRDARLMLTARPVWCFIFGDLGKPNNKNISKTTTTLKPISEVPHLCVGDVNQVTCSLDKREKCPRTFDLKMMREVESVECSRSEPLIDTTTTSTTPSTTTTNLPPATNPPCVIGNCTNNRIHSYLLKFDSTGNELIRQSKRVHGLRQNFEGGICEGPFMCEYSPFVNKFMCPKELAFTGLCIPLRKM